MRQRRKTRAILAAVLLATAGLGHSARADFAKLSDLLSGGTLQSGDKLFSNFSYSSTGDMPAASGVNVTTITDAAGNFGLRFQAGFGDEVGGGPSDALIGYTVTVTDPGRKITDAHVSGNPAVAGGTGSITVTDTFIGSAPNTMQIFSINPGTTSNSDSTDFATPLAVLQVQKDIRAFAGTGVPNLSFVDQTYSQTVPEPASVALLGLGLGVVVAVKRSRKGRMA